MSTQTNKKRQKAATEAKVKDALGRYLSDLRHYPVLSREDEQKLAKRAADGDVKAVERLVECNLRLVVKIAYEYKSTRSSMLDLIQEGNVGLVKAVNKFDASRGTRLSSYAQYWIRAYILKHLMDSYNLVKIGTTQAQRKLFFNLKKEKEKLRQQGISPTPKRVSEQMGIKEKTVAEMDIRMSGREARLDARIGDDESTTLMDTISDQQPLADERLDRVRASGHLQERLNEFRETLEGRDQKIWDLRMVSDDPRTLRSLGEDFGVSRERVRQLEARIKRNLKKFLNKDEHQLDTLKAGAFNEIVAERVS